MRYKMKKYGIKRVWQSLPSELISKRATEAKPKKKIEVEQR